MEEINHVLSNKTSIYALPDIIMQLKSPDVIWSPSMLQAKIENDFNIPLGMLWLKTRAPQFAIARYTFLYILQTKMGIEPALISIIYGNKRVDHVKCWNARKEIKNILSTKTPRHYYIKIDKLIQKVKKWDVTELTQKLELQFANHAVVRDVSRNTLKRYMEKAQYTAELNAKIATEPEESNLQ